MNLSQKALIAFAPLALLALSIAAPVPAAETPSVAPVVQGVIDCRKIPEADARLACFDKAAASLEVSQAKGDLVTLDRQQRRTVRRQAFGLILPSLAMFDRGEKPEDVDRATFTIASAYRNAAGKWVMRMDDGAMWRQIDDNTLFRAPHQGSTADIRKAALGSFFLKVDGQPAIRAHRDN
ncbi:MAG TPA: hypothetical protein VII73_06490 [Caulobacteraceae bacterium]